MPVVHSSFSESNLEREILILKHICCSKLIFSFIWTFALCNSATMVHRHMKISRICVGQKMEQILRQTSFFVPCFLPSSCCSVLSLLPSYKMPKSVRSTLPESVHGVTQSIDALPEERKIVRGVAAIYVREQRWSLSTLYPKKKSGAKLQIWHERKLVLAPWLVCVQCRSKAVITLALPIYLLQSTLCLHWHQHAVSSLLD